MDESFKLKTDRTTPRVRSATPKSGRVTSKGFAASRSAKLQFLQQCVDEHSAGNLLRKSSPRNPSPKTVSRQMTSSFAGIDQQKMMSYIYGSLAGQTLGGGGGEKMKHSLSEQVLARSTARNPVYKTQEEYYDEVLVLKKKIKELTADNSTQKLKVRRLEEDFQKKEREVEQLLDPLKNNEVRRTLADGKTDSGIVVQSFKQKILKLEQQLREKESAYSKLQSDLKTTKIDEMKIQLETFYNEMIRLKTEKASQSDQTLRDGVTPKVNATRVKELTTTILKMSVEKTRLLTENKSLKEDLQKCIETKSENGNTNKGLSQKQIMSALAKLEQKFDKFDTVDGVKSRGTDVIAVQGGVGVAATAEEMERLRQRETELKTEVERQSSVIESIKQDRAYYVEMCQKKDNEIALLKKEVDDFRVANDNCSSRHRRDSLHGTPSLNSDPVAERETPRPKERLSRRQSSTSLSSAIDTNKETLEKVGQFKRNRAAKVIQKNWTEHKVKDVVKDEAAELIQESWRGHRARQETSQRMKEREEEEEEKERKEERMKEKAQKERVEKELREANIHREREERNVEKVQNGMEKFRRGKEEIREEKRVKEDREDENERHDAGYDDAIEVIQSTVRGHMYRSHQIKISTSNSQTTQHPKDKSSAAKSLSSSSQKIVSSRSTNVAGPLSDDDDDEIAEEIDEDIDDDVSDDDDEEDDIANPMIIK